jgi:hypothetical protein
MDAPRVAGRPRAGESRRRTMELLEHVAAGDTLVDAARAAKVKPERVLRLLDDGAFFAVYQAVRRGDLPPTAAIVHLPAIDVEPEAA